MHISEKKTPKRYIYSPYLLWLVWIVWLPFLLSPVLATLHVHFPLPRLLALFSLLTLFIVYFLWVTWRLVHRLADLSTPLSAKQDAKWRPIAILFLLCLPMALLGQGSGDPWLDPLIYVCAYMAGRLSIIQVAKMAAAFDVCLLIFSLVTRIDWFYLVQGMLLITGVGFLIASLVRAIIVSRELRAAREEIARLAITTERLRIARDLHDLLGHNLSLIALKSELAERLLPISPERATVEIRDVKDVARTTLQEVREAVSGYRQPTLSSELQSAQEILVAAGITYQYEGEEDIAETLPSPIETVLAWTVREGVTNVIRHSRAHRCLIRLTRKQDIAGIEVIDHCNEGLLASFFQPKHALIFEQREQTGNGLRGLTERATALHGNCEAGPHPGNGYRLAVSLPLVE